MIWNEWLVRRTHDKAEGMELGRKLMSNSALAWAHWLSEPATFLKGRTDGEGEHVS